TVGSGRTDTLDGAVSSGFFVGENEQMGAVGVVRVEPPQHRCVRAGIGYPTQDLDLHPVWVLQQRLRATAQRIDADTRQIGHVSPPKESEGVVVVAEVVVKLMNTHCGVPVEGGGAELRLSDHAGGLYLCGAFGVDGLKGGGCFSAVVHGAQPHEEPFSCPPEVSL